MLYATCDLSLQDLWGCYALAASQFCQPISFIRLCFIHKYVSCNQILLGLASQHGRACVLVLGAKKASDFLSEFVSNRLTANCD